SGINRGFLGSGLRSVAENIPVRPRRAEKAAPIAIMPSPPKAPKHLTTESRKLFDAIVAQWQLGVDGIALLTNALESRDAYEVCRKQVAKDGPTFKAENGMIRVHPGAKLAIDYLSAFRQSMRQLGLQPEE
ncbi:MAG: P27 family phage terminase small subunit, partial [Gemmatimonadaceae bacterium]